MTVHAKIIAYLPLALILAGCNLLNTADGEDLRGTGAEAFSPYESSNSGAIRLSLQMVNGCAVLASGHPVAKGATDIPYPDTCPDPKAADPEAQQIQPEAVQLIVDETDYFLNQFVLMDLVVNRHTNPTSPSAAVEWMATQSRFRNLDWSNVSKTREKYRPYFPDTYFRDIFFGNAAWMTRKDDSLLVEVLDAERNVRTSVVYSRKDFLAENATNGHSRAIWQLQGVGKPAFPGDPGLNVPPGMPPVTFRTAVRVDWSVSTNPFKTFRVANMRGDGSIRVTWSQLPNEPIYFPVRFVPREDLTQDCFTPEGAPVRCDFGLTPELKLDEPANGQRFYVGGESFEFSFTLKDASGNLLHKPGWFPSYQALKEGKANGLLFANDAYAMNVMDGELATSFKVAGPIDQFRPVSSDRGVTKPYFAFPPLREGYPIDLLVREDIPGLSGTEWPNRIPVRLPENALPGTYAVIFKAHRQYNGERMSRTVVEYFQVGTKEKTAYQGQVGNCQICHRGVLSFDNIGHGMPVDHVESCKVCHSSEQTLGQLVHEIHAHSPKYPREQLKDCGMCHLTRASATRSSVDSCASCHPSTHGTEYFDVQFSYYQPPTRFGNCAQSCHENTAPTGHVLPEE